MIPDLFSKGRCALSVWHESPGSSLASSSVESGEPLMGAAKLRDLDR